MYVHIVDSIYGIFFFEESDKSIAGHIPNTLIFYRRYHNVEVDVIQSGTSTICKSEIPVNSIIFHFFVCRTGVYYLTILVNNLLSSVMAIYFCPST